MEIGSKVGFIVISSNGTKMLKGKIQKEEYHIGLGKSIFSIETPSKNIVKLSRNEISLYLTN